MTRPTWQLLAGRISRLFAIQYYDLYFAQRKLFSPSKPVIPSISTEVRLATTEDLDGIALRAGAETRKAFEHNIGMGSRCFVALHQGTVTGYLWVNRKIVKLLGMYVAKLPAKHSFSHGAFVFPEYRSKKIYQYLRHVVCTEMYESGCIAISCLVDKANTPSINVLKNEGHNFRHAGVLKLPGNKPILLGRALFRKKQNRYSLADLPHLLRTPLGQIQFRHGIYYRLWPLLSVVAGWYRRKVIPKTRIVSVVGSFGKSTTTRVVTAALQKQVHEKLSLNCWSYLSGVLFRIRPRDRHSVIEVGINNTGQMGQYASMIRPDIVVVTSIGSEHHRSLGSLDVTCAEKGKMVEALPESGLAVLNGDDPNVLAMAALTKARVITYGFDPSNDVRASEISLAWPEGSRFRLHTKGETRIVTVSLVGPYMVYPVLAAIAIASHEGFTIDEILSSLQSVPPTPGRLEPLLLANGAVLLRDDYKSSLETIHVALEVFSDIPAKRRGIVMGEVSEPPGSQGPIYRDLGRRIAETADYAIFVGGNFQRYAAGAREAGMPQSALFNAQGSILKAAEYLSEQLEAGDTVLLKGRDTQRLGRVALVMSGRNVRCDIDFCDTRVTTCQKCPMLERGWDGLRVLI
jgi:UDP-N-acetylmuramoyl-tripeptide--D-alanyl-D-alanine ligase